MSILGMDMVIVTIGKAGLAFMGPSLLCPFASGKCRQPFARELNE
jgi:hypothetical protein